MSSLSVLFNFYYIERKNNQISCNIFTIIIIFIFAIIDLFRICIKHGLYIFDRSTRLSATDFQKLFVCQEYRQSRPNHMEV